MPTFTRAASWYTTLTCFAGSLAALYLPPIWGGLLLSAAGWALLIRDICKETA